MKRRIRQRLIFKIGKKRKVLVEQILEFNDGEVKSAIALLNEGDKLMRKYIKLELTEITTTKNHTNERR